jgi:predicted permease
LGTKSEGDILISLLISSFVWLLFKGKYNWSFVAYSYMLIILACFISWFHVTRGDREWKDKGNESWKHFILLLRYFIEFFSTFYT